MHKKNKGYQTISVDITREQIAIQYLGNVFVGSCDKMANMTTRLRNYKDFNAPCFLHRKPI